MNSNRLVEQVVENIRRICRDKHVSIMQMESDLGFSAGLISRWSKTKTSPSFDKIVDIMRYLDITYDDLMGNVRSGEPEPEEEAGGSDDIKILIQLEKGSVSGALTWEKAGEDMPFEMEIETIFPHMLAYYMHRCYYVPYGKSWFLLSVQYNEDTAEVLITVYRLPMAGMGIIKIEGSEEYAIKLLRVVDEEIFNAISRKMADKMKEDFLNEEF